MTFPEQQTVFTPHFKEGPEDGFLRPLFFCGQGETDIHKKRHLTAGGPEQRIKKVYPVSGLLEELNLLQ
jgi:hypothetical protein